MAQATPNRMVLWGLPGSGKTTFLTVLLDTLARFPRVADDIIHLDLAGLNALPALRRVQNINGQPFTGAGTRLLPNSTQPELVTIPSLTGPALKILDVPGAYFAAEDPARELAWPLRSPSSDDPQLRPVDFVRLADVVVAFFSAWQSQSGQPLDADKQRDAWGRFCDKALFGSNVKTVFLYTYDWNLNRTAERAEILFQRHFDFPFGKKRREKQKADTRDLMPDPTRVFWWAPIVVNPNGRATIRHYSGHVLSDATASGLTGDLFRQIAELGKFRRPEMNTPSNAQPPLTAEPSSRTQVQNSLPQANSWAPSSTASADLPALGSRHREASDTQPIIRPLPSQLPKPPSPPPLVSDAVTAMASAAPAPTQQIHSESTGVRSADASDVAWTAPPSSSPELTTRTANAASWLAWEPAVPTTPTSENTPPSEGVLPSDVAMHDPYAAFKRPSNSDKPINESWPGFVYGLASFYDASGQVVGDTGKTLIAYDETAPPPYNDPQWMLGCVKRCLLLRPEARAINERTYGRGVFRIEIADEEPIYLLAEAQLAPNRDRAGRSILSRRFTVFPAGVIRQRINYDATVLLRLAQPVQIPYTAVDLAYRSTYHVPEAIGGIEAAALDMLEQYDHRLVFQALACLLANQPLYISYSGTGLDSETGLRLAQGLLGLLPADARALLSVGYGDVDPQLSTKLNLIIGDATWKPPASQKAARRLCWLQLPERRWATPPVDVGGIAWAHPYLRLLEAAFLGAQDAGDRRHVVRTINTVELPEFRIMLDAEEMDGQQLADAFRDRAHSGQVPSLLLRFLTAGGRSEIRDLWPEVMRFALTEAEYAEALTATARQSWLEEDLRREFAQATLEVVKLWMVPPPADYLFRLFVSTHLWLEPNLRQHALTALAGMYINDSEQMPARWWEDLEQSGTIVEFLLYLLAQGITLDTLPTEHKLHFLWYVLTYRLKKNDPILSLRFVLKGQLASIARFWDARRQVNLREMLFEAVPICTMFRLDPARYGDIFREGVFSEQLRETASLDTRNPLAKDGLLEVAADVPGLSPDDRMSICEQLGFLQTWARQGPDSVVSRAASPGDLTTTAERPTRDIIAEAPSDSRQGKSTSDARVDAAPQAHAVLGEAPTTKLGSSVTGKEVMLLLTNRLAALDREFQRCLAQETVPTLSECTKRAFASFLEVACQMPATVGQEVRDSLRVSNAQALVASRGGSIEDYLRIESARDRGQWINSYVRDFVVEDRQFSSTLSALRVIDTNFARPRQNDRDLAIRALWRWLEHPNVAVLNQAAHEEWFAYWRHSFLAEWLRLFRPELVDAIAALIELDSPQIRGSFGVLYEWLTNGERRSGMAILFDIGRRGLRRERYFEHFITLLSVGQPIAGTVDEPKLLEMVLYKELALRGELVPRAFERLWSGADLPENAFDRIRIAEDGETERFMRACQDAIRTAHL